MEGNRRATSKYLDDNKPFVKFTQLSIKSAWVNTQRMNFQLGMSCPFGAAGINFNVKY